MTDKELKKLLRERPYLIDGAFVRSHADAARFIEQNGSTMEAFLTRAKLCSTLPPSVWEAFSEALKRKYVRELYESCAVKPKPMASFFRSPRLLKRAAAVSVLLALVTAFFTLTKPGAALAKAGYQIMVRMLNGTLTAQQNMVTGELPPIDFESIPERFDTPGQAAGAIGRPVAFIERENIVLADISAYAIGDAMLTLRMQYQVGDAGLYITQTFCGADSSWGSAASLNAIDFEIELADGNTMYMGAMEDGTAYGAAFGSSYNVSIACAVMEVEELVAIAESMRFTQSDTSG